MKNIFKKGDEKTCRRIVSFDDAAAFQGVVVHPVCSTFSLAREIEWTSRQFVLEMCEKDEEGIGTFLSIDHKGPAFVGEELVISACVEQITINELSCSYKVKVEDRLIAFGKTGQKIFKREVIDKIFRKV